MAKEDSRHIIKSQVCPAEAKVRPYAPREELYYETHKTVLLEYLFLSLLLVLICVFAVNPSKHIYWCYIPHPSLLHLADSMNSTPDIFYQLVCAYDWTLGL